MKKVLLFLVLLVTANLSAQLPSPTNGKKWEKVEQLSDEFNGNSIDTSKWYDYHPFWSGRAPSNFKKGNAFVSDGYLNLRSTLRKEPSSVQDPFKDIWVDAAAAVSKTMAQPGYYYEARFKASSLSMTSSFWFRVGKFSEIDVIEHIGNPSKENRQDDLPYQYHVNTHYYGKHAGLQPLGTEYKMPGRGRDNFYTYGFWWKSPNELLFYFNGEQVMRIIPRVPLDEELRMIFDTEVFPFATAGVANIGLPKPENLRDNSKNTMKVDWVRVYKLVDGTGAEDSSDAPIGSYISLKKTQGDGKFVTGEKDGSQLIARGATVQSWEKFKVEKHPKGGISLKANSNGKYVQVQGSDSNKPVRAAGDFQGDWEQFEWKSKGNGLVALKSVHTGKWLQAPWTQNNAIVRPKGPVDNGWETFSWKKETPPTASTALSAQLETKTLDGIRVYPSPASETLTIEGVEGENGLRVFDSSGNPVLKKEGILSPKERLNVSGLIKGNYLLRTGSGEQTWFQKN
ncbi:Por secretion system C-terminal sorting domain-containing protein [Zobellia uliginosa]|uniref:Por secretion system C-terminal sorting domain-containing protein n=1 Tax=Zobellia uliginosa TaxID=143224 RepID=A0ABY1KW18_9FLAO|nr:beta-porphyranase PorA [Zobellia uliginosa]SIS85326.1 Por secretion system C-terminal sorting domain-containing protein [Zobellia uliginosa]